MVMVKTVQADCTGFKRYVAPVESFAGLASMGHVEVEQDKLFYLLQGY